jgi:hypothetical protein
VSTAALGFPLPALLSAGKYAAADYESDEVSVLIWPGGHIEHFARGTTAGDIVADKGLISTGEGYDGYRVNLLINVNNRLVPEDTVGGFGSSQPRKKGFDEVQDMSLGGITQLIPITKIGPETIP